MTLRSTYRSLGRLTRELRSLPGTAYAALYIAARLNHVFHAAGLSPAWQFRLLPGRLQVSRRLMRQPYWVPLSSIKWGGRPRGGERRKGKGLGQGIVFDGDWDIEDKREIDAYLNDYIYSKAVFQIFRDAMDYRETDQYKEMMQFVESGQTSVWQVRGCRSESDVNKYFADMRKTFDALSEHSYLSQQELGSDEWFDEIKVYVDRNGELHKQQAAGHHRLAMARILNIAALPVLVLGVHRQWAERVQRERGKDVISSIDDALVDMAPPSRERAT